MKPERRQAGGEVRAEGRRLSGVVMSYGDVGRTHRERFEPGSLVLAEAVTLDLFHDRTRAACWYPNGGMELREEDGELRMVAELPPIAAADRALALVASGEANGLSVDFHCQAERREGGLRVVERALLKSIGLVSRPDYKASRVEARSRRRRLWL